MFACFYSSELLAMIHVDDDCGAGKAGGPQSSSQVSRDDAVTRLLESMYKGVRKGDMLNSKQDLRGGRDSEAGYADEVVMMRSKDADEDDREVTDMYEDMQVTVVEGMQLFEQQQVVGVISLVHCGTLVTQNQPREIKIKSSDTVSSVMHTLGLREPAHYLVCRERVLDPTCTIMESAVTDGDTLHIGRYMNTHACILMYACTYMHTYAYNHHANIITAHIHTCSSRSCLHAFLEHTLVAQRRNSETHTHTHTHTHTPGCQCVLMSIFGARIHKYTKFCRIKHCRYVT
jgi:hypothetical protein